MTSRTELDLLLSGDPGKADALARQAFDRALATAGKPQVVLYGAGNLAKKAAQTLKASGVGIAAWTDRDPKKWGQVIEGIPIVAPEEAIRALGGSALWVIAIFNFKHKTGTTMRWLKDQGVAHIIPIQALMWKHSETFLPYFYIGLPSEILEGADRIRRAWDLLADDESRAQLISALRWRLSLDPSTLVDPVGEVQYFPPSLLPLEPGEVFVDCGAFDGDTLRYMQEKGAFPKHSYAFEPDPVNFLALRNWTATLPPEHRGRVSLFESGVGAEAGEISFMASGNESSGSDPSGNLKVPVVTLDDALAQAAPTMIKMDIEGMELDALQGASKTLTRHRPKLAICVYHRPDHLWEVPLAIHEKLPDHRLFIRGHCLDGFEWVCYALPSLQ